MTLLDMLRKLKEIRAEKAQQQEIDPRAAVEIDSVTKDRYLRSLRRQRRTQLEELEKESLKRDIAMYEKIKARQNVWGFKDNPQEAPLVRRMPPKRLRFV